MPNETTKNLKSIAKNQEQLDRILQQLSNSLYGVSDTETSFGDLDNEFRSILDKNKTDFDRSSQNGISTFIAKTIRSSDSRVVNDTKMDDVFNNIFKNGISDSEINNLISNAYRYQMVKQADLDELVRILPELSAALNACVDVIVSGSEIIDGSISRILSFDGKDNENTLKWKEEIESMEKRFDLHTKIKRYIVPNTLKFGSYYLLTIPYSKLFSDFLKFKNSTEFNGVKSNMPRFSTFGESVSLYSIMNENGTHDEFITESVEVFHNSSNKTSNNSKKEYREEVQEELNTLLQRVIINKSDSPITMIDESFGSLEYMLNKKHAESATFFHEDSVSPYLWNKKSDTYGGPDVDFDSSVKNTYKSAMKKSGEGSGSGGFQDTDTSNKTDLFEDDVRDCYIKLLSPNKISRIEIMGERIGYLYSQSEDMNLIGGNITGKLNNAKFGKDPSSSVLLDNIAAQVVNSFDKPYIKDNIKFKKVIANILNYYDLNTQKVTFQFIPVEYVQEFNVNEDENGLGTSIFDKALFFAKLYAIFLLFKIFSNLLYSNDSRNVFIRNSGIDKNTRNKVEEIARTTMQRRVNVSDLFNYTSLLNKMSYGNDVYYPTGMSGEEPIRTEIVQGQEVSMETDFMEKLKRAYIIATEVPSAIINYLGELDFSRQAEMANAKFVQMIISLQIDLATDITEAYKEMMRYSTNIPEEVIDSFHYSFPAPKSSNEQSKQQKMDSCLQQLSFYTNLFFGENWEQNEDKVSHARKFRINYVKEFYPELELEKLTSIYKDSEFESVGDDLTPDPNSGIENMEALDQALGGMIP